MGLSNSQLHLKTHPNPKHWTRLHARGRGIQNVVDIVCHHGPKGVIAWRSCGSSYWHLYSASSVIAKVRKAFGKQPLAGGSASIGMRLSSQPVALPLYVAFLAFLCLSASA